MRHIYAPTCHPANALPGYTAYVHSEPNLLKCIYEIGKSHHTALAFLVRSYIEENRSTHKNYQYGKGNYDQARHHISALNWEQILIEASVE